MQPYYFPYLGYFSLIATTDIFIVHDDVKYTKKGFINRNKITVNSSIKTFTLALKNAPDSTLISEKAIADDYDPKRQFRILEGAYARSPFWDELRDLVEPLLHFETGSLSEHLIHSIKELCNALDIHTEIKKSSDFSSLSGLNGRDRVLEMCHLNDASKYLNPVGGLALYDPEVFRNAGLALHFLEYQETTDSAVSAPARLSIVDSLANFGVERTKSLIAENFRVTCHR